MLIDKLQIDTPNDTNIVMVRSFKAPRDLVFRCWTECDLIKKWLGPASWELSTCDFNGYVGGTYRYVWSNKDSGESMGMGGTILEFDAPSHIKQDEKFDEAWYDGQCLSVIDLVEESGVTTVTMTIHYDTKEVRDTVVSSGMTGGIEESYHRMDALLASL